MNNEYAFKFACFYEYINIINLFVEEFRYDQSPYYYHNKTGYIINHEPLDGWLSCTILDCPIIYYGRLDEPAVIAFMATLKIPKSARS